MEVIRIKKLKLSAQFRDWVMILVGSLIGAASYPLFLTPNHIAPGGLTGVTTVLNYLFPVIPIGIASLAMNIPLFAMGYHTMGRGFALRSLVGTALFSVLIDILPLPALTNDPMLASLFGGVMLGAGLGLILRGGATTGGTDMAARIIHERWQHITTGTVLFCLDCISVVLAGVAIRFEFALYAFISIFISSRVIDAVMLGISRDKACYIISEQNMPIKRRLLEELNRGITVLHGEGGWTEKNRPVLLCVISPQEVARLKGIVLEEDPSAFVFISDAYEVLGEGFHPLKEE